MNGNVGLGRELEVTTARETIFRILILFKPGNLTAPFWQNELLLKTIV